MREIKFRAWNDLLKSMHNVSELYVDSDGKLKELGRFETILMQFTGQKDLDGVDIYEGDLLAIDRDNGNPVEVREVKYITGCAGFNIEGYLAFIGKVVGNIHENPELLEQK